MDIFLLNKKDIYSKMILHKNLCNMHIAPRNKHIAQVSIMANIVASALPWGTCCTRGMAVWILANVTMTSNLVSCLFYGLNLK
jgi:hypothetical protein